MPYYSSYFQKKWTKKCKISRVKCWIHYHFDKFSSTFLIRIIKTSYNLKLFYMKPRLETFFNMNDSRNNRFFNRKNITFVWKKQNQKIINFFTLFFKLNMEFLELTTYMLRLFYFVSLCLQ